MEQLTIRFHFPALLVGPLVAADERVAAPKIFADKVAGFSVCRHWLRAAGASGLG
jgi:hypothetical protein